MRFLSLCIIIFFGVAASIQAQQSSILSSSVERKIAKADKKIAKGDAIVDKQEKYIRQIEAIEAEGKKRRAKVRRLKTKCNKIIVSSASFYKDGYGKKYVTYKKAVDKGMKDGSLAKNALSLMNEARSDYKTGRKLRRKSVNLSDVNRAAAMLLEANEVEAGAIRNLIQAAGKNRQIEIATGPIAELVQEPHLDSSDTLAVPLVPTLVNEVAFVPDSVGTTHKDSIPELLASLDAESPLVGDLMVPTLSPDSLILYNDSTMSTGVSEPLSVNTVVIEDVIEEVPKVYFSVQFLADKKAVSKERLRQFYEGPFELVTHVAEGWHRYSFGKFDTLHEASEMKTRSGVKGYVVAYLNEERITIKEASAMLKQ